MDRDTADRTAKAIGFGIGAIIAIWVFLQLLPYLVVFLALCGAWHLFQEYERSRHHRHNRRNRR